MGVDRARLTAAGGNCGAGYLCSYAEYVPTRNTFRAGTFIASNVHHTVTLSTITLSAVTLSDSTLSDDFTLSNLTFSDSTTTLLTHPRSTHH